MATLHNLFLLPVFYAFIYSNQAVGFEGDEDAFSYVRDPLTSEEQISLDIMKLKALAVPEQNDFYNEMDHNIKEWNVEENPDLGRFYLNNNDILKKRSKQSYYPLSQHFSRPAVGGTYGDYRDTFSKCQTIVSVGKHEQEGYKFIPSHFRNFTCVPYLDDGLSSHHKHVCFVRSTGGGADECKTHYEDIYVLKKEIDSSCWKPEKFRIAVGCKCSVGLC